MSGVGSSRRDRRRSPTRFGGRLPSPDRFRVLAIASAGLMTVAYVSVLVGLASVVGMSRPVTIVALWAFLAAAVLSPIVSSRLAAALGVGLLVAGSGWYLTAIPDGLVFVLSVGGILHDLAILLSGLSVLHVAAVGTWITAFTPAPVFLSWILVFHERYVAGAAVGAVAIGMLVLTGDAGLLATVVGTIGIAGTVGFGDGRRLLDETTPDDGLATGYRGDPDGGRRAFLDVLVLTLSAMVLGTLGIGRLSLEERLPGRLGQELVGGPESLDGSLVGAEDQLAIVGGVELSPEVRYTITSDEAGYWRADAYDRYTGGSWVRTGDQRTAEEPFPATDGPTRPVDQRVEAESRVLDMPALWQPVDIHDSAGIDVALSPEIGLRPDGALTEGDSYTVLSRRPIADRDDLVAAGVEYPDRIVRRYTQLPESVSDRVIEHTAEVIDGARSPFEAARRIETHLREVKDYSLDVDRPSGEIADAFLFEMDAGYCTYFATAMVVMLRAVGVPARFATGYTSGERIDENRWIVRGLNAHAWVEVFFPGIGWIPFEPTPRDVRDLVHGDRLAQARAMEEPDVDTAESEAARFDDTIMGVDEETRPDDPAADEDPEIEGMDGDEGLIGDEIQDAGGTEEESVTTIEGLARTIRDTDPETIGLGLTLAIGAAAGARRTGVTDRVAEAIRGRDDQPEPAETVRRSYRRLERAWSRTYHERAPGETPRTFVERCVDTGGDERALTVLHRYERVQYGHGITEDDARDVVSIVDDIVPSRRDRLDPRRNEK